MPQLEDLVKLLDERNADKLAKRDQRKEKEFEFSFNMEHNPVPGSKLIVKKPQYIGGYHTIYIRLKELKRSSHLKDMNTKGTKEKIISLFEKYGEKDYIGEEVSQLEHALQTAQIAEENGEDADMILAALLHDIGHLLTYEIVDDTGEDLDFKIKYTMMGVHGIRHHESHGERWLKRNGVRDPIPELVGSHVISKKWLCRDKKYYDKLSEASKHTLRDQGGPMTDEEEKEYLANPLHNRYTQLRLYDDGAKVKGKKTKDLEYFLKLL